jgi:hypothetical protein
MADQERQPETAQRLFNLLYLIRVTAKLGEDILPPDFVAGYNQALEDMMDAMKCEFDIAVLEWMWEEAADE